jgi:hypothetical protein
MRGMTSLNGDIIFIMGLLSALGFSISVMFEVVIVLYNILKYKIVMTKN